MKIVLGYVCQAAPNGDAGNHTQCAARVVGPNRKARAKRHDTPGQGRSAKPASMSWRQRTQPIRRATASHVACGRRTLRKSVCNSLQAIEHGLSRFQAMLPILDQACLDEFDDFRVDARGQARERLMGRAGD